MTTWEWVCRVCGYSFINPIFRFIDQCPECDAEYIKLGEAQGLKAIGIKPIYILKNEGNDFSSTKNVILFSIAVKAKKIECYNREFYIYLQENFSEEIKKGKVDLELIEK